MSGCVVVFAKPPGAGAKTRLARELGVEVSTALARAFLSDTIALVRSVPGARVVLATTDPSADHGVEVAMVDQGGGDLGARLERVIRSELTRSAWVTAIGADSPGLPSGILVEAAHAAAAGRAAVGPAADGGFTALTLPRCPAGLLAGLPWSQPTTGAAIWERLVSAGLNPVRLEPWFDLDEPQDLVRFRDQVPRDRAPHTWAALDRLTRA